MFPSALVEFGSEPRPPGIAELVETTGGLQIAWGQQDTEVYTSFGWRGWYMYIPRLWDHPSLTAHSGTVSRSSMYTYNVYTNHLCMGGYRI